MTLEWFVDQLAVPVEPLELATGNAVLVDSEGHALVPVYHTLQALLDPVVELEDSDHAVTLGSEV